MPSSRDLRGTHVRLGAQASGQLISSAIRQEIVNEDQVVTAALGLGESGTDALRQVHRVALLRQQVVKGPAHADRVIDQQQTHRSGTELAEAGLSD